MAGPTQFTLTEQPQDHFVRRREMLAKHPELAALQGHFSPTAIIIVLLVTTQLGLSYLVRDLPIWQNLLLAYFVGAIFGHALFVMIHDATHNLVLKSTWANKVMGIVSNLPTVIPSAISFRKYHLLHHNRMGELDFDADLPSRTEAKLVGSSRLRKALWLFLFPFAQAMRPARMRRVKMWDGWTLVNVVIQIGADVAIFVFFGPTAFLYLFASTLFGLGLHPLGGRWIQEHFVTRPGQETYSYYGPANLIAFNVGHHYEHHDMMNVPWVNLPKLRKQAPEFYDDLASYQSWTKLVLRFIFSPELSSYSRIIRPGKASKQAA